MFNLNLLTILFSVGTSLLLSTSVTAQLVPDSTLGRERSTVRRNVKIRGYDSDLGEIREAVRIDGGARRGRNLFHSFREFNVGRGRGVYFTNPAGVENILTRVTGRNRSLILGRLGVLGGANLFLINPNGILFGKNATLDLRGSFYATTADGIKLGENASFSATDPASSNLLTVQPGALFQNAMRNYLATIENRGNLSAQGNLFLSADQLNLQGQLFAGENLVLQARDNLKIRDNLTQPFIASARENLIVEGQEKLDIFTLNHPSSGLFSGGDLVLRSANTIVGDSHYLSGGNFSIEQLDRSSGNWSSIKDPIIRSIGDVSFNNYTGGSLQILAGGSVNVPGFIIIDSPDSNSIPTQVTLSNGTAISLEGNTRPTVDIRAGVDPNQIDFNLPVSNNLIPEIITSARATSADINIGGILISGENAANGTVFLTNQYQPNLSLPGGDIRVGAIITSDNFEAILPELVLNPDLPQLDNAFQTLEGLPKFQGDGGDVIIDSRNSLRSQPDPISRQEFTFINTSSGSGNSGDITLIAKERIALNNSFVLSDTLGRGQSGNITIKASSVDLDNTVVSSNIQRNATGNGGNISIDTEKLRLNGDARVLAVNFSSNENTKGGDITISATELIEFRGIQEDSKLSIALDLFADIVGVQEFNPLELQSTIATVTAGNGAGGDLTINTGKLISQRAVISTGNIDRGTGGKLNLNATSEIELIETGVYSPTSGKGNAQDVTINTGKLILRNGSVIATLTINDGNAGNIFINATESVELSSPLQDNLIPSGLFAGTFFGTGNAGNITIDTGRLIVEDGTSINALTGIILPDIPLIDTLDITSVIDPNLGGKAGNIIINARESVTVSGATKISSASDSLSRPSLITASTSSPFPGGNIKITTEKFILQEGAQVSTATFLTGNAGELRIVADEIDLRGAEVKFPSSFIPGSGLLAVAGENSTGNGGTITLDSQRTSVQDGATIAVSSQGTRKGGDINLTGDSLTLDRRGSISAETTSDRGGNINIDLSDRLVFQRNSSISATAGLEGDGGNVTINSPFIIAFPTSNEITANADRGRGGNINITTNAILGYPQYLAIRASSQRGIEGTVTFNNLVNKLDSGVVEAPITPIDATALVAQDVCEALAANSSFVVKGKGGVPPSPSDLLDSQTPLVEWTEVPDGELGRRGDGETGREGDRLLLTNKLSQQAENFFSQSPSPPVPQSPVVVRPRREDEPLVIQQARGWIKKPDGTIVLTSYPTEAAPSNYSIYPNPHCSVLKNRNVE